MIHYHRPSPLINSISYVKEAMEQGNGSGDGPYTKACEQWLEDFYNAKVMMTTSGTHALEMACQLLDLKEDDQVIVPSYTFPSTANCVLLSGAKVVFCPVSPHTLTMDVEKLASLINDKTRAIIPVHYGGIGADMPAIMKLASSHNLVVIEDNAQGFMAKIHGHNLGSFGHMACLSFHGSKDVVAGEGGALIINDYAYEAKARIFRQKGTNREAFIEGKVDKYQWVDVGSSMVPSDLLMAVLYGQLQSAGEVLKVKRSQLQIYEDFFAKKESPSILSFLTEPEGYEANGHLFYLVMVDAIKAKEFMDYMAAGNIETVTHFMPLHASPYGRKLAEGQAYFRPEDFVFEEDLGRRLVRLPLHYALSQEEQKKVLDRALSWMEAEHA